MVEVENINKLKAQVLQSFDDEENQAKNAEIAFGKKVKLVASIGAALITFLFFNPLVIVDSGQRGVVTTFGKVDPVPLDEGIHLRIPVVQKVIQVETRIAKIEEDNIAASKDLQNVVTKVALNYHIDPSKSAEIFQTIGDQVTDVIVKPAIQESVKAITAQYTAEELITKREDVKYRIFQDLKAKISKFGIIVDEISITNFEFSKSFEEAIESKNVAEQLKLKASRDLERIKVEAEQKVASAQAEAESLRIQRAQVTPEMLKLRSIENDSKAIEKWDGKLPTMTSGAVPFLNIDKK